MKAEKRIKRVTVRFSEDEYNNYLSMFKMIRSDYKQSEFIRDCIFNSVPPKLIVKKSSTFKPTQCDKDRLRQLVGLASNINQTARNLNILMKSSNKTKLLSYLQKLDEIYLYCESAMYEKTQ